MNKKFICTVCGYIHEGPEPPERCPVCKVPASKFKEITEEEMEYATVHKIGDGKPEGVSEEMIEDLRNHQKDLYADAMGFENLFMNAWKIRETILDAMDGVFCNKGE